MRPVVTPTTENVAERNACRFCGAWLQHTFVDLGMSPLCESVITEEQLNSMEPFYPLRVFVCDECFLVQLLEYVKPQDIYTEYAYFSSYSDSWLEHARLYVEMITARFKLSTKSQVVELASNDGYLLRNFVARGIFVGYLCQKGLRTISLFVPKSECKFTFEVFCNFKFRAFVNPFEYF